MIGAGLVDPAARAAHRAALAALAAEVGAAAARVPDGTGAHWRSLAATHYESRLAETRGRFAAAGRALERALADLDALIAGEREAPDG